MQRGEAGGSTFGGVGTQGVGCHLRDRGSDTELGERAQQREHQRQDRERGTAAERSSQRRDRQTGPDAVEMKVREDRAHEFSRDR